MTPPVNDDEYKSFADTELDATNMEAVAANAEQDVDMHQAIRHSMYVGWVLAMAKTSAVPLIFGGGNRVSLPDLAGVHLVIPYPPTEWQP